MTAQLVSKLCGVVDKSAADAIKFSSVASTKGPGHQKYGERADVARLLTTMFTTCSTLFL